METIKIGFIINPVSGGKKKNFIREKLVREFKHTNCRIEARFSEYSGHASELASQWVEEGFTSIVAVGGDGTINHVARSLMDKDTSLGIIPFGSGNGFARHFGFPLKLNHSLKILKAGITRKIDVGIVDGVPFFCTSGLGFDAETGYQFSHFGKRGFFNYAFSFMRVFQTYQSSIYTIRIGDTIIERDAFFINVANISQFGYNFKIAPDASTEDGTLDLVIVNKFPKWKGFKMAAQSFMGNIHKNPYVEYYRSDKIIIETSGSTHHIHIDGEPGAGKKISVFTIRPGCLKVILPVHQ